MSHNFYEKCSKKGQSMKAKGFGGKKKEMPNNTTHPRKTSLGCELSNAILPAQHVCDQCLERFPVTCCNAVDACAASLVLLLCVCLPLFQRILFRVREFNNAGGRWGFAQSRPTKTLRVSCDKDA